MNKPLQICICGGGSQGHISTGVIGSKNDCVVRVLTRRPSLWSREFVTVDLDGNEYHANIEAISDNPSEVIPQSDIILICLPGYALREELKKIKPFVRPDAIVGCAFGGSGFFIDLFDVFGEDAKGFALQRVPYTGRVREYGHSASLKGYKPYLKVATHNIGNPEELVSILRNWYSTPVYLLRHWLEVTLSNSNPLLHPCRMSVMFKDWTPGKEYDHIPYMYNTDWDDESSQCWIDCDNELHAIMAKLPMDKTEVPTVLEYYGCDSVESLTAKMQSIVPFKTVQAHMNPTGRGTFTIDSDIRYFTEDIPFGLILIKSFGELTATPTPEIDKVIYWAQNVMGKEYLVDGKLTGRDIGECCVAKSKFCI